MTTGLSRRCRKCQEPRQHGHTPHDHGRLAETSSPTRSHRQRSPLEPLKSPQVNHFSNCTMCEHEFQAASVRWGGERQPVHQVPRLDCCPSMGCA